MSFEVDSGVGRASAVCFQSWCLIALLAGSFVGCAEADPGDTGVDTSAGALDFADVHPIFVVKCAGPSCHSGELASIPSFAQMDRVSAYEAGLPAFEFMWGRLSSGNMPAGRGCASNGQFVEPPPPGCLDEHERHAVQTWLDRGYVE